MRDQYVSEVEVECSPGHMDTHPFQRKVLFGVCVVEEKHLSWVCDKLAVYSIEFFMIYNV